MAKRSWAHCAFLGPAFVVLALAPSGCDRGTAEKGEDGSEEGESGEKTDPPKGKWEDKTVGSSLKFDGRKETVEVSTRGERGKIGLHLTFNKFPKGTKATVGEDSTTIDSEVYGLLQTWLPFKIGDVSIADARDHTKKTDLDTELVIEWPTTTPLETEIPPQKIWSAVAGALKTIDKSPVKFEGEPEGDGKVDTVVALDINGYVREVLGSGEKLQDIDLLATEVKNETSRTKKCTGYEKGDIQLVMVDSVVKLYDRRSGKLVEEKTFSGKDECPSMAFVSADGKGKSYADGKEMDAWLKGFIK